MAVTLDYYISGGVSGSTTGTWSHTVGGANRLLLVMDDPLSSVSATSVTYGGVPLTYLSGRVWGLTAPTVGTANIVVTYPSIPSPDAGMASISFNGVDQASPTASPVLTTGNSALFSSTSATTNANGLITSIVSIIFSGLSPNPISGTLLGGGGGSRFAWQSGSTAVASWDCFGNSQPWGVSCVLVMPVGSSPSGTTGQVCIIKRIYRSVVAMFCRRKVTMGSVNRKFKV